MEENKVTVDTTTTPPAEEPKTEQIDYKALYEQEKAEREKFKLAFDKSSSETAEYKRKLSERLTKEEADKLAQEERDKVIAEQLAEREQLLAEKRIASYSKQMMSAGMPTETADELAAVLPEGIPDQFFDGIKKFIADTTAQIRAEALKQQPVLTPGIAPTSQQAQAAEDLKYRRWMGLN